MSEYLPFVLIGLTTGSVYGLMSVGLVLTYRTSGIYNLAHGSIAALAITVFFIFYRAHGWPLWLSLVLCVPLLGLLVGAFLERLARRLALVPTAYKVVATVGLVLVIDWLAPTVSRVVLQKLWVPDPGQFRRGGFGSLEWLPSGTTTMWDTVIGHDQLVIMAIVLVATVGLWLLLRASRLGIAMRAVVDDPDLLELAGTRAAVVRRWAWSIGAAYAALGGLLLSNRVGTSSAILTALVVQATGAAAFGAFRSIPLAYVGGLVLGVVAAVATKVISGSQLVQGIPVATPFLFLFVALLVVPRRRLVEISRTAATAVTTRLPAARLPRWARWSAMAALAGTALIVPYVADNLQPWMRTLSAVVICLGLGLLARTSGQISLCHYSFAAVGACAFSNYAAGEGMPWLVALVLAGLTAVPVGALIAIPAIRLSGLFLALATLAFAYGMQYLLYSSSFMFETGQIEMPRPSIALSEERFYYLLVVCIAVGVGLVALLHRSRLGRLLGALSDSPTALETQGTTANLTRVLVFCISAFFAAVGGALLGCSTYYAGDGQFSAQASLYVLTVVMIAPGRGPWIAFPAAAMLAVLSRDIPLSDVDWAGWRLGFMTDYLGFGNLNQAAQMLVGVAAVAVAATVARPRRRSRLRRLLEGGRAGTATTATTTTTPSTIEPATVAPTRSLPPRHRPPAGDGAGLVVDGLVCRYGALVAVDDVHLEAPMGRITGLIGPNGAGKSTLFDACSGLLRPTRGSVHLDGRDVTHLGPAARARLGLGRTFQRARLWGSLTVAENVALGREGAMAGGNPLRQVVGRRGDRAEVRDATDWAIGTCGLDHLRDVVVTGLTTSERRLVELARCLASASDLLLLDEPSSGLDAAETRAFGGILRDLVDRHELGVLLVEHDMSLVMDVCDHIYVLDVGQVIAEGTPGEIRASEVVRAAYLGVDDVPAGR
jgi:ABC-type branched-subunit amino acid transport system ATPase component/branched-subunit amino acid ABC-type transport system permease component